MGWVTMSERELQRIQVLSEVTNRRRTMASAAVVLALSTRQMRRLLKSLSPWWRRCHRPQGPWPAVEQQAGG